jgi:hypothetical protein
MPTEHYTVVALPHSISADAGFHVSLFVAPQLVPDGDEGRLDDFSLFLHWGAGLLTDAEFGLRDQQGPIAVTPVAEPIDAALWDRVFGPDTPVRGQVDPDWSERHWRTFRAAELHDFAKLAHVVAMALDPTSPLAPSAHPLTPLFEQLGAGDRDDIRRTYDESQITRAFDDVVGEGGRRRRLAELERSLDANDNAIERLLHQMHRARRFYERPETAAPYQERPDPGATTDRPPRPDPHFAERCAMLGDHPMLQRSLGLVVDLRVDDPARLATSQWLSGRIVVGGATGALRTTRTRCERFGEALVTVASTDDWRHGRLRIADPERFAVLDMDADGAALKLDRYLLSLPRLLRAEHNGDPVHAAPTALRSTGFTVVRHRRALDTQAALGRQIALRSQIDGTAQPLLSTEDVTQGVRVEVWDDTAGAWFSLHDRTIDVSIRDDAVVSGAREIGFIEGTAATEDPDVADGPVHVHESMFGWDGWSLSAPKPGNRVRHVDGDEIVEDPTTDTDLVTPLVIGPQVSPGTLPRLRYGRSYAFRVWATDLAGNSRPHAIGPAGAPTGPSARDRSAARAAAGRPVAPSRPGDSRAAPDLASAIGAVEAAIATRAPLVSHAASAIGPLRSEAAAAVVRRRTDLDGASRLDGFDVQRSQPADLVGALPIELRDAGVAEHVAGRVAELRGQTDDARRLRSVDRATLVARAFEEVVFDESQPLVTPTARFDARVIAASAINSGVVIAPRDRHALSAEIDAVTPLVPFLRWDPIQPPAIVARHAFTAGESLRQVVVRSGVTQDLDTLEVTVSAPGDYGPQHAHLGYRATSERHLAPPKTSQSDAELHGAFDDAIGSTDPDDHRRLLAIALRERGTFFDVDVPDLADPAQRTPQAGIELLAGPDTPTAELASLPLPDGDPPFPGQYVIHDTDELSLPYLPDVPARGISVVFPDAGTDRAIAFPFGTEGFTARYELGDAGVPADDTAESTDDEPDGAGRGWPLRHPFRLVLAAATSSDAQSAPRPDGRLEGRTLTIQLPAGHAQRFRLSSSMHRRDLQKFGLWRILPPALRDNTDVAAAAVDGWLWAFTPFDEVRLVHAVPRPVAAPRVTILAPIRAPGATSVGLFGGVELHGPSTGSLTAECRWTDPVDDVELDGPEDRTRSGLAFTTPVMEWEDFALLGGGLPDTDVDLPVHGPLRIHHALHELDDTLHRTVHYRLRAATRFREYFDAEALVPGTGPAEQHAPGQPVDDGQSVVGPEITVNVLSTARPDAPVVHSVIPLFRWDATTEPHQPVAVRRRRRAGVRIYLERPWYSSGAGELLGVLLAPGGNDAELTGIVSQWGSDPVWISAPVGQRGVVVLDNLIRAAGLDDRPGDAAPVVPPATRVLGAVAGQPDVVVLGYRPQYSAERRMWYVDVAVHPGDTFWPFVRLCVARYQPHSVAGHHLSAPVLCDFVQLTPERTASVSRTDVRHVRVVVSGPVGLRQLRRSGVTVATPTPSMLHELIAAHRKVVARLQRRDPSLPTDLGWETVAVTDLVVRGRGISTAEAAWVGVLKSPEEIPLRRPDEHDEWRVTVEEWERLPGDPADLAPSSVPLPPVWEQRLVYADEIPV